MSKKIGWVHVLCLVLVSCHLSAQRVINVPLIETPPVIDGALNDSCWSQAFASDTFYDFDLKTPGNQPNADTAVRFLTDGSWLYVGFECQHPDSADMQAQVLENFGGNVFGDECVKIFLNPGLPEDQQVFRYVLNYKNVHENKRMITDTAERPILVWPSATALTPAGWTAEVAIPLFDLAGYGDLNNLCLHIFRKKILKQYDAHAVNIGFTEEISSLNPASDWLARSEMATLSGLDSVLKPDFPFVANLDQVAAGGFRDENGQMCYSLNFVLKGMTAVAGTAEVVVTEKILGASRQTLAQTFPLRGYQVMPVSLSVPVDNVSRRDLEIALRNPANEMLWQTWHIHNAVGGDLLSALPRFNYYTSEENVEILYKIGMSGEMLADKCLVVYDAEKTKLASLEQPAPQGQLSFPLAKIGLGEHALTLALEDQTGRDLFSAVCETIKLEPCPEREWKVDRANGGTLLQAGEPFFPLGFCMDVSDSIFAEIADAGFNTVLWWSDMGLGKYPQPMTPADFVTVAEMARKHGLKLMARPDKTAVRTSEMLTLPKYFSEKADIDLAHNFLRTFIHYKYLAISGTSPWNKLTRAQRNEIAAEWMDIHLPFMLENVRAISEMPHIIGYNTMDEPPEFREADLGVELTRWTEAVKAIDPYRPVYVLYSSHIPQGREYTDFADALGTDPYWIPGANPPRGSINWMSYVTARNVVRSAERGLMPWTIPMSSLWSSTFKRMISGAEQVCQSYLALIHGTRGLIYFTHGHINTEDQWQGLKTVASRVNRMVPALTAADPESVITYAPGVWAPERDEVPDVQCRLMRFPEGQYVLLAANVRHSPVEITVTVDGLADSLLNDLFDGELGVIQNGTFTDILSASGTRSYAFDQINKLDPVKIDVRIKALGEENSLESAYDRAGRPGFRNILPNSSFELESVPGWPDYYTPHAWHGGLDVRIGNPDAALGLTTENPFHGEKCLFVARPFGNLYWSIMPQVPAPQPYVFSFYARTDSPTPAKLTFQSDIFDGPRNPVVEVTGNTWQRHYLRLTMPAYAKSRGNAAIFLIAGNKDRFSAEGTVYLDAFQFEPGIEPTEFEP